MDQRLQHVRGKCTEHWPPPILTNKTSVLQQIKGSSLDGILR